MKPLWNECFDIQYIPSSVFGGILFINSTILKSSFLLKKKGGGRIFMKVFTTALWWPGVGSRTTTVLARAQGPASECEGSPVTWDCRRVLVGDFSFLTMKIRVFLNLVVSFLFLWDWASSFRLHLWLVGFNGFYLDVSRCFMMFLGIELDVDITFMQVDSSQAWDITCSGWSSPHYYHILIYSLHNPTFPYCEGPEDYAFTVSTLGNSSFRTFETEFLDT